MDYVALYSREAEKAVLAALLIDTELFKKVFMLSEDDFYFEKNLLIFKAIKTLHKHGRKVDILTVRSLLEKWKKLDDMSSGYGYLASLEIELPDLGAIGDYAGIVKDYSVRRKFLSLCQKMYQAGSDATNDLTRVLTKAEYAVSELRKSSGVHS